MHFMKNALWVHCDTAIYDSRCLVTLKYNRYLSMALHKYKKDAPRGTHLMHKEIRYDTSTIWGGGGISSISHFWHPMAYKLS